ncbi:hypothetical protein PR202_gb14263 [Eleusine coracana subsp. coracana]|uniref:Uncharacterized protein n=1 Tax=Eleusine coracana subsp. coracana TaxID=191504 RepID=A0AAV5ESG8_ELECO|nr:hypothetical protein PR202_gb14263 [Eleusine coracana subsp. coracana]
MRTLRGLSGRQSPWCSTVWGRRSTGNYLKALAFGSANPRDHPRITAVAREISRHLDRTLVPRGASARPATPGKLQRPILAQGLSCHRQVHVGVVLDLLPVKARRHYNGSCLTWTPPKTTLQDVLTASAASSTSSGLGGGGDPDEGFAIQLCRETLYMDRWYTITYNRW